MLSGHCLPYHFSEFTANICYTSSLPRNHRFFLVIGLSLYEKSSSLQIVWHKTVHSFFIILSSTNVFILTVSFFVHGENHNQLASCKCTGCVACIVGLKLAIRLVKFEVRPKPYWTRKLATKSL